MKYIAIFAIIILSMTIISNAISVNNAPSKIQVCKAKCLLPPSKKTPEECRVECVAQLRRSLPHAFNEVEETVVKCSQFGRKVCKKSDNAKVCKWDQKAHSCKVKAKRLFTEGDNCSGLVRNACINRRDCTWSGNICK